VKPPAYLELHATGELARRAGQAVAALSDCVECPRRCRVDRLRDEVQVCGTGRRARLSAAFPHFGEEDCLRGWRGSGTIFFASCSLKCVFCQNHDTSQGDGGREVEAAELAEVMLALQRRGCHNINLVTPEHVVPQLLEALVVAADGGLELPLVYNTSGYDTVETLRRLDGVVDVYMPDFKVWTRESARRYLKAKDYPEVARAALREMHRQVGPLVVDPDGLARRGVLVRHLVMPGLGEETAQIFRFLAEELSPETYVNVMDQYHPDHQTARTPEIDRRPTGAELERARRDFFAAGLTRIDARAG